MDESKRLTEAQVLDLLKRPGTWTLEEQEAAAGHIAALSSVPTPEDVARDYETVRAVCRYEPDALARLRAGAARAKALEAENRRLNVELMRLIGRTSGQVTEEVISSALIVDRAFLADAQRQTARAESERDALQARVTELEEQLRITGKTAEELEVRRDHWRRLAADARRYREACERAKDTDAQVDAPALHPNHQSARDRVDYRETVTRCAKYVLAPNSTTGPGGGGERRVATTWGDSCAGPAGDGACTLTYPHPGCCGEKKCHAPDHINCPCGWDLPQACNFPEPSTEAPMTSGAEPVVSVPLATLAAVVEEYIREASQRADDAEATNQDMACAHGQMDGAREVLRRVASGEVPEQARCARCAHPPHLGPCNRRAGDTAYTCLCTYDTIPSLPGLLAADDTAKAGQVPEVLLKARVVHELERVCPVVTTTPYSEGVAAACEDIAHGLGLPWPVSEDRNVRVQPSTPPSLVDHRQCNQQACRHGDDSTCTEAVVYGGNDAAPKAVWASARARVLEDGTLEERDTSIFKPGVVTWLPQTGPSESLDAEIARSLARALAEKARALTALQAQVHKYADLALPGRNPREEDGKPVPAGVRLLRLASEAGAARGAPATLDAVLKSAEDMRERAAAEAHRLATSGVAGVEGYKTGEAIVHAIRALPLPGDK
jgi:hypothetical protein